MRITYFLEYEGVRFLVLICVSSVQGMLGACGVLKDMLAHAGAVPSHAPKASSKRVAVVDNSSPGHAGGGPRHDGSLCPCAMWLCLCSMCMYIRPLFSPLWFSPPKKGKYSLADLVNPKTSPSWRTSSFLPPLILQTSIRSGYDPHGVHSI